MPAASRRTPAALVLVLLAASVGAGCTDRLGLNAATFKEPDFSLEPAKGDANTVFKVDSLGLGDAHNVTWEWGDGAVSYGPRAEHKYGFTNGEMTVTMLVTSASGDQSIASKTLVLGSGKNRPPTLTLSATRTWVEVGKTVNVTARGNDLDRDPLTYIFRVRPLEGGPADERAVEANGSKAPLVFDAPGKYVVSALASDPKGGKALANVTIQVSRKIPSPVFEATFNGTIVAGTAGTGLSEKLWGTPAPDTGIDAARHRFSLQYPGYAIVVLQWNDTSTQGAFDLDLELRAANGTAVFKSETRAPAMPFEFNMSALDPGDYDLIVRGHAGADVKYVALVSASLQITPELVAKVEGDA